VGEVGGEGGGEGKVAGELRFDDGFESADGMGRRELRGEGVVPGGSISEVLDGHMDADRSGEDAPRFGVEDSAVEGKALGSEDEDPHAAI
jgi:hypothetical protein